MAYVLADNIISPLGGSSCENYRAVKSGRSGLRAYEAGSLGVPEAFTASLLSASQTVALSACGAPNRFEALVEMSVRCALADAPADIPSARTVLIISSTKGAVDEKTPLAESAKRIARNLGISGEPIVVCNACTSGVSALMLACRLLDAAIYDYAVVCGADTPQRFVISGFQSLKALAAEPCRPFDMERCGLNLGEAAATVILSASMPRSGDGGASRQGNGGMVWQLSGGCIRNDAFHISAPSKSGEGLYLALCETLQGTATGDLALVNAHGTATLFNDQMESVAMQCARLSEVPANALKGYFGHTLGAAGVLETILCMKQVEDGTVLATHGFEELGVSGKVDFSAENRRTAKRAFVKMLSGFGGCNATIMACLLPDDSAECASQVSAKWRVTHRVGITPGGIVADGKPLALDVGADGVSLLTEIYRQKIGNYPKYYKMDALSRLGFVASELLLQTEGKERFCECDNRAVVLFNSSSSACSDRKYMESIDNADGYFPSPSVFVYTLPNIVTGEIAIRNRYHGETSFYVLPCKDKRLMGEVIGTVFADRKTTSVLGGWIDYDADGTFEADLFLAERQ